MECSIALVVYISVKFMYSEKATKFDELVMTLISNFRWIFRQIFVAFSEYMNFNLLRIYELYRNINHQGNTALHALHA